MPRVQFIGQRGEAREGGIAQGIGSRSGAKAVEIRGWSLYSSRSSSERGQGTRAAYFAHGLAASATGMPTTARMPCSAAVRAVSLGK